VDGGANLRTAKHLLSTRPIFNKLDEIICGHVFCKLPRVALKKALEDRISALGRSGSWPQIIADLDSLTGIEIEHEASASWSAPRPGPPPVSPLARSASHCRQPSAKSPIDPTDSKM
jgi:hypothetical protein